MLRILVFLAILAVVCTSFASQPARGSNYNGDSGWGPCTSAYNGWYMYYNGSRFQCRWTSSYGWWWVGPL